MARGRNSHGGVGGGAIHACDRAISKRGMCHFTIIFEIRFTWFM